MLQNYDFWLKKALLASLIICIKLQSNMIVQNDTLNDTNLFDEPQQV